MRLKILTDTIVLLRCSIQQKSFVFVVSLMTVSIKNRSFLFDFVDYIPRNLLFSIKWIFSVFPSFSLS